LVVSHGNSGHSKHRLIFLWYAQVEILQKGFSFGMHPPSPLGQAPFIMRGHFSQAIPQTPIFIQLPPVCESVKILLA
jgi:hypothetical protein